MPIKYFDQDTPVHEGDVVEYRSLLFRWIKRRGRVSYVPGVSKFNSEMEHDGLSWVGISGEDDTFRGIYVDPATERVKKGIFFVERSTDKNYLKPEDMKDEEW